MACWTCGTKKAAPAKTTKAPDKKPAKTTKK